MLDAALERMGSDVQLLNRTLDTADLTLHLAQDGAFADVKLPGHLTLDTLADLFGVIPHDRATAARAWAPSSRSSSFPSSRGLQAFSLPSSDARNQAVRRVHHHPREQI